MRKSCLGSEAKRRKAKQETRRTNHPPIRQSVRRFHPYHDQIRSHQPTRLDVSVNNNLQKLENRVESRRPNIESTPPCLVTNFVAIVCHPTCKLSLGPREHGLHMTFDSLGHPAWFSCPANSWMRWLWLRQKNLGGSIWPYRSFRNHCQINSEKF